MPDPNQQQQGLPNWINRAGDAAGAIGQGLGAALPYALPAALGAAIGAGSGRGGKSGLLDTAAGALAGGLEAKGVQSEAEEKAKDSDAELDLKRQQIHMEAQKADLEIQEGQMKLSGEKAEKEYADKYIKDPVERALYYSDKPKWAAEQRWKATVAAVTKDPSWPVNHPGLDANMLLLAGPEGGPKLIEASGTGKAVNGFHTMTTNNSDGTTTSTSYAYGPIDPRTGKPSVTPVVTTHGVMPKTIASPPKPTDPDKAAAALDAKVTNAMRVEFERRRTINSKASWLSGPSYPDVTDGMSYDDWAAQPDSQKLEDYYRKQYSAGTKAGGSAAASGPPDGATATNPATGAKLIRKDGKWVPVS